MTAPLSAAESFLTLLDDLPSVTKPRTNTDVLLKHAAACIREQQAEILDLRGKLDAAERGEMPDAVLDGVLGHVRTNLRTHVAAHRERWTFPDHIRQDGTGVWRAPDLSHLPPMAAGEPECEADSPRDEAGMYWTCRALRGHPERWHADYTADGTPFAAVHPDAAWPVTDHEEGLPNLAFAPALRCGALDGGERWRCNAVQGHAPLDHTVFAPPYRVPVTGAVLARWPSVQPGEREWPAGMHELHCRDDRCSLGCDCPCHRGEPVPAFSEGVPRPGSAAEQLPAANEGRPGPGHPDGHALRPPGPVDPLDCPPNAEPAEPFRLAPVPGEPEQEVTP